MECGLVVNGPHFTSSVLYPKGDQQESKMELNFVVLYSTLCPGGGGGRFPIKHRGGRVEKF